MPADAPNSGTRRTGSKYATRVLKDRRAGETGGPTFPGSDITGDDLEFIRACERYQREHRRPFPTFTEILKVAKALGYRKVAADTQEETK